jgi:tRNA A37 threonylcarbamoyladenosine modification protein TsaB
VSDPTIPNPTAAAQGQQGQQQQQIQVPIIDTEMENIYCNWFRVSGNWDEVLVDVGFHSQVMGATGPEPVNLSQRLIMNFVNAKKLAEVLRVVVARHEQLFGVVEVDPNRRLRNPQQQQQRPMG